MRREPHSNCELSDLNVTPSGRIDKGADPDIQFQQNSSLDFDNILMSFFLVQIHRLNLVLKNRGISNSENRMAIVSDFFEGTASFLNGGGFMDSEIEGSKTLVPRLAFGVLASNDLDIDPIAIQNNLCPVEEYMSSIISQYYDEFGEEPEGIKYNS